MRFGQLLLILLSMRVKGQESDDDDNPAPVPGPTGPEKSPPLQITHTVTFDIEIEGKEDPSKPEVGSLTIGLFGGVVPNTVANFVKYVNGQGAGERYEGTIFHRVIKGFIVQGGDLTGEDGKSGFENTLWFPSENFDLKHVGAGWVSMANGGKRDGKDTNGSQFFVTLAPAPALDGLYVVFGKVIAGMGVVRMMEKVETNAEDKPMRRIVIKKCSSVELQEPFPTTLRQPVSDHV